MINKKGLSALFIIGFYFQSWAQFYCSVGASQTADTEVVSVQLTGDSYNINRTSTACGPLGLQDYTLTDSANVIIDSTFSLAVAFGTCGAAYQSAGQIWIDWNQDGNFSTTETISTWTGITNANGVTTPNLTVNVTVPATALAGRTRMRVMLRYGGTLPLDPCSTTILWGSVEDYTIRVQPSGACITPPMVGNVTSNFTRVCANGAINLGLDYVSYAFGPSQSYQWQHSLDSVVWTNITNGTSAKLNTVVTTSRWYRVLVTCGTSTVASLPLKVGVVTGALAGGTYTINSALLTQGNNFSSFGDFIKSASCIGISGPIVVNVVPNVNGYNEQVIIENIPGSSAANSITINGGGARIYYNGGINRGTLLLIGAKHIKFKTLVIEGTSPEKNYALEMRNNAQFIEFDSCVFKVKKLAGFGSVHAIVAANNPQSWWQVGLAASNVTIKNSEIIGGQNGIYLNGDVYPNLAANNLLDNNHIYDFFANGIEVSYQENCVISNNDIERIGWDIGNGFDGIVLSDRMDGAKVVGNRIHGPATDSSTTSHTVIGIFIAASNPAGDPILIANNALYNVHMNGATTGIYLHTASKIRFYHNTISIEKIPNSSSTATQRAFHAAANSGIFEIKNNVFNVNFNGSGTNYALYIANSATYTIDYNHYFVSSTLGTNSRVAFWLGSNYATLGAWQTANNSAFEQNGVFGDPNFATDLVTPLSAFANANGTNLITLVPTDLLGVTRSITPDRGAIEYAPSSCLAPTSITHSQFSGGIDINWVNSTGADSVLIEYGVCGFARGTGTVIYMNGSSHTLMGLMSNTCYTIYLQSWCGGLAGLSTAVHVNLVCGAATIPLFNNFSNSGGSQTAPSPPQCWTHLTSSTSPLSYAYGTNLFGPKNNNHWLMYNGANAADTLALISPQLIGLTNGNVKLSFWAKSGSYLVPVRVYVGTMTRLDDPQTISILDTVYAPENYSEFTTYFNTSLGYNGTDRYVVFMVGNTYAGQSLYIDDVSFSYLPTCHPPIGIALGSNTPSSATITWANMTSTCFNLEYGPTGFTKGTGTVLQNVSSPTTISNLTPYTSYDVYIANCCLATNWAGPVTISSGCLGQLNGNYTINKNAPTGGINFAGFQDFIDALSSCGVSGAVTANVTPGSGPYIEQILVGNISGASAANKITINGNGNYLSYAGITAEQPATLTLNASQYLEIKNLNIVSTGTSICSAVQVKNGASHNTFDGCFIAVNKHLTSISLPVMVFSDRSTNVNVDVPPTNFNTVKNCIIEGGNGIALCGPTINNLSTGNVIENNEIRDFYQYGLSVRGQDNALIKGNDIHHKNLTLQSSFNGIRLQGKLENVKIISNRIHDPTLSGTSTPSIVYLLQSYNLSGSATKPILIANNVFYNTGYCHPVSFEGTGTAVNMYHNTFTIDAILGVSGVPQRVIFLNSTSGAYDIKNNILSCTNIGTGTKHLIYIANTSPTFSIDYNHYYMNAGGITANNHIGYWNGNFNTLATWQTANNNAFEANGVVGNPQFASASSGNLTPFAAVGNNNAINLNTLVPFDYYNKLRSTMPDRGAVEFVPVTNDISIASTELKSGGVCMSSNDTLEITLQHVIGSAVNFATTPLNVHWEVSGPINSSGIIPVNTGVLAQNSTITVSHFSVNMSLPGNYSLRAYLDSNSTNQYAVNDTLDGTKTEVLSLFDAFPKGDTVLNSSSNVAINVRSRFLNAGDFFISEVCHLLSTTGGPSAGWPSWLKAGDYIEITGAPYSDLGGYKLQQWGTSLLSSYTFPPGTILSSTGTAIIAVGELGTSIPSPANYYYHGNGSYTGNLTSSNPAGRVLKNMNDSIVDAVAYGTYTFPAASGVTQQHWSGATPFVSGSAGNRLIGPDLNNGTNWITTSTVDPQTPNVLNQNLPLPNAKPTIGFSWSHNGTIIDTNVAIVVGPWPNPGVYKYVASLIGSTCGPLYDTVTVYASFAIACLASSNASAINVGCDSATVVWTSPTTNVSSNLEYGVAGFVLGSGNLSGAAISPFSLNGLAPGTYYDVYITDSCLAGYSNPVKVSFTTSSNPMPIINANYSLISVGLSQADVQFTASSSGSTISWDFGDGNIGIGNNPTHSYTANGTYTVIASAANGCGIAVDTLTVVIVGIRIEESTLSKRLNIFPNPNTGKFHIAFSDVNSNNILLQVVNLQGQLVYSHAGSGVHGFAHDVDLSHVASGIYVVQITTDEGMLSKRVMLQK